MIWIALGWLGASVLVALGVGRWFRYQSEHDRVRGGDPHGSGRHHSPPGEPKACNRGRPAPLRLNGGVR